VPFAGRAREALRSFATILSELRELKPVVPLTELVKQILELTGYARYLRDGTEEGEERWANVVEVRNKAQDYEELDPDVALQRFLEEVSLVQDVDTLEGESDAVTLITLHAAKGLEFPHVFILGVEEGLCPHVRSFDDPTQMEEERRLFYVGVTRAMRSLYLVYAGRRSLYGGSSQRDPSRFLRDIPDELLSFGTPAPVSSRSYLPSAWSTPKPAPAARSYRPEPDYSSEPEPAWLTEPERQLEPATPSRQPSFKKGDSVSHPAFGDGVVLDSQIVGNDEQVSVLFKQHPTPKKLSLSFAPLQRV
jgi:DNA helicase-2/ATP-dependent DNA helicase PcrA